MTVCGTRDPSVTARAFDRTSPSTDAAASPRPTNGTARCGATGTIGRARRPTPASRTIDRSGSGRFLEQRLRVDVDGPRRTGIATKHADRVLPAHDDVIPPPVIPTRDVRRRRSDHHGPAIGRALA